MISRDILVAVERVADQHRIGFVGGKRAIALKGDRHRRQRLPAVERQRRVDRDAVMLNRVEPAFHGKAGLSGRAGRVNDARGRPGAWIYSRRDAERAENLIHAETRISEERSVGTEGVRTGRYRW